MEMWDKPPAEITNLKTQVISKAKMFMNLFTELICL